MGKKMLTLRLCSSSTWFASPLIFFSPPIFSEARSLKGSPDKNNTQQTEKQRQKKQAGHPSPAFPQKKIIIPVHPLFKAVAPVLSHRDRTAWFFASWLAISRFTTNLQKKVFDEAKYVGVWLSVCISISSSSRGKTFPPKFELTPARKQPSTVVRHISQFGRHCCPGVSKPVPADGDSS